MARKAASGQFYRFDGLSILVADDNRFVRSILVTVLKAIGCGRVVQAENREEAMAILDVSAQMASEAKDIDMVFADHLMDPGNGIELLKWIRSHENEKIKFLPVIMMSGEADVSAVTDARDAGVTEYLAKPMSVAGVATRMLAVIDRPRQFVRTADYFGPDRRRQTLPYEGGDKRQMGADDIKLIDEGDQLVLESQKGKAAAVPAAREAAVPMPEESDERRSEAAG